MASLPISIQNVSKRFGDVKVLNDISLDIVAGEFLSLLGPSGSGKTTLLNVIAGFAPVDSGWVYFSDQDVTLLPPHKRNLGIVFQNYALFPHMTVAANVAFPLLARDYSKADIASKVRRALELVELGGFEDRKPAQLSGGQRQRVALARAVVFDPKIILMDEPLSALDKQLRERMQIELRHLHSKLNATTVYVTHDQREALTMSDRIAVMNHGRILQLDDPRTLYDRPGSAFIARFIGECSLVPVTRDGSGVLLGGTYLKAANVPVGADNLLVAIRSEKLTLVNAETGTEVNRLGGRVREVVFQGDSVLIYTEIAPNVNVPMRCMYRGSDTAALPAVGDQVVLGLHPNDTVIVAAD